MIREYRDEDFARISHWVMTRDKKLLVRHSLPRVGLIKEDIACGFVHFTGTNTFFLEAFATNPAASIYARGKGVLDIALHLVELAKKQGASRCVILTDEPCFIKRLKKLGFATQDMTMGISYFF